MLIEMLMSSHPIFAWNHVGHEVVAEIAYDNLNPKTKSAVNTLTAVVSAYDPHPETFIESAVWADQLIAQGVTAYNAWHYIDLPLQRSGHYKTHYREDNVVFAIHQAELVLLSTNANQLETALFLRFFIHFVGDIHQPLHAAELYSPEFPRGDKGGNLYKIKGQKANNLHHLWDACFNLTADNYPTPASIHQLAKSLEKTYPKKDFKRELQEKNPEQWAKESHEIAKDFVYNTPYNQEISAAYEATGEQICRQQLALAGYRLAEGLNTLLKHKGGRPTE